MDPASLTAAITRARTMASQPALAPLEAAMTGDWQGMLFGRGHPTCHREGGGGGTAHLRAQTSTAPDWRGPQPLLGMAASVRVQHPWC